jgi:hypothetical protein
MPKLNTEEYGDIIILFEIEYPNIKFTESDIIKLNTCLTECKL